MGQSDTSSLPEQFEDEQFDLVAKEMWLQGFWLNRREPGLATVHVEPSTPGGPSEAVAVYTKGWNNTRWLRMGLAIANKPVFDDGDGLPTAAPVSFRRPDDGT